MSTHSLSFISWFLWYAPFLPFLRFALPPSPSCLGRNGISVPESEVSILSGKAQKKRQDLRLEILRSGDSCAIYSRIVSDWDWDKAVDLHQANYHTPPRIVCANTPFALSLHGGGDQKPLPLQVYVYIDRYLPPDVEFFRLLYDTKRLSNIVLSLVPYFTLREANHDN